VCAVRCGDGVVGTGETCDDGNTVSGDGCSGSCVGEDATCADGTVELGAAVWGRRDIIFCRTATLPVVSAAGMACGSESHLCSSTEFVARNDLVIPPSGLKLQATLSDSGCLATHYDPVIWGHSLNSDLVRGDTPMTSVCPGTLGTPWGAATRNWLLWWSRCMGIRRWGRGRDLLSVAMIGCLIKAPSDRYTPPRADEAPAAGGLSGGAMGSRGRRLQA
jgi:cysteine-rich repeat protein